MQRHRKSNLRGRPARTRISGSHSRPIRDLILGGCPMARMGWATTLAGRLTAPEHEVLRLITDGRTDRAIPQMLGYPVGTAKNHVQKVIGKLEVSDRTQAAVKAVRLGLVEAAGHGSKR